MRLTVTNTENGIRDGLELCGVRGLEPLYEVGTVVRGLAFVTWSYNDQRSLWQRSRNAIHRTRSSQKSVVRSYINQCLRKSLAGSSIRTVQDSERGQVLVIIMFAALVTFSCAGLRVWFDEANASVFQEVRVFDSGSNEKCIGFDGQRSLDLEVVVWLVFGESEDLKQ